MENTKLHQSPIKMSYKPFTEEKTHKYKMLVLEIHDWIMSNEGMGIGESAEAMTEAQAIVKKWIIKCIEQD